MAAGAGGRGGASAAAFGGSAELMSRLAPDGPVYQAGTLSGNPVATAAGLATLRACTEQLYPRLETTARAIADAAKRADRLILATDPDREGAAISWHLYEWLKAKKALPKTVERVTFNAITKAAVTEAASQLAPAGRGAEVEEIVAKIARVPSTSVSSDDRGKLKSLDRDLTSVVFGQDPAIDALAAAIKMARSGLGKPDKPIGSFLFLGPSGVGKTEVARQLATLLGIPLQRFDMSEYMERHSVSRLIGAPPGYVGYDQGGLLTDAVDQQPHSVLLLDEIEKAHPDVYNILLQVMDHGKLTDHNGRQVDFRNVILIMTTNAGASDMAKAGIGFMFAPNHHASMKHAAPVRKELGVRTIFNILGPLTNPAGAPNILMGVFHPDLVGIQVRVLQALGAKRALVVWGRDGMDEISLGAATLVGELRDGVVREYEVHPEDFGIAMAHSRNLRVTASTAR